jgi:predicted dehydrogenase
MADLKTIHPLRKRSTKDVLTFARASGDSPAELENVPIEVDDYGAVLFHLANGASGSFSVCQLAAGRKCTIDLQVYGTVAGMAWNHEKPSSLWIGHRNRASEVLIENPLLQKESTARFARLPAGHPLGYYDAVYNLFSEFYRALTLRREGQPVDFSWPALQEGYEEMLILESILTSHAEKRWVQVSRQ